MIAPSRMRSWKNKPVIIDISTPDLIDLKAAHEEGITVIKAGNLPGRFACISAGNIIAECIRGETEQWKINAFCSVSAALSVTMRQFSSS